MNIAVIGLSHQTAPVELRELLAFTPEELPDALRLPEPWFDGAAILSTCNRTELYITASEKPDRPRMAATLAQARGQPVPEGARFYLKEGIEAARHLFRVAAGIESLVVGESEILGQVRAAFAAATSARTSSPVLARLFHSAIRAGRRARSETEVGAHGLSVSATAVALVRQALGDLRRRTVLVVGAGDAARLTAQALTAAGAGRILVTTRTYERARDIAAELGAYAYSFEQLPALLSEADIVISSTSAPGHVIERAHVEAAMKRRRQRPLALVDIAVPRDVEPAAGEIPGVRLFDIDDLQAQAEAHRAARQAEVAAVEAIVEEEVARFAEWLRQNGAVPTIAVLRRRAERVRQLEVERTLARLPGLTPRDRKRIEAMSKAIVKRLLHEPVTRLREGSYERHVQALRELFGLEEDDGAAR
ncbi:MAG TPA: glutamyl-tRNA reductase [Dehalococcoidia bacterium]|nr:glutamyl-tRNA reductase [Dehalococcoidia bacterium]